MSTGPNRCLGCRDERGHGLRIADVALDAEPADPFGGGERAITVDVGHDDAGGAALGEAGGQRQPDASRCSGDDDDLPIDLHACSSLVDRLGSDQRRSSRPGRSPVSVPLRCVAVPATMVER